MIRLPGCPPGLRRRRTPHSPIVLDLDGDGIETLALGSNYFDLNADGLSERTGGSAPMTDCW